MRRTKPTDYTLEYLQSRVTVNENGCWETGSIMPMAYLDGRYVKMSRVALAITDPSFDIDNPKIYACHKCDNDACINPSHLFPGTSSDNQKDHWNKVKNGKTCRNSIYRFFQKPRYVSVDEQ